MWILWSILYSALGKEKLGNNYQAQSDLEQGKKIDSLFTYDFIKNKELFVLDIFPINNRLCSHFPYINCVVGKGYQLVFLT